MAPVIIGLCLFGIALIALPFFAATMPIVVGTVFQILGALLLLLGGGFGLYSKVYKRSSANQAFVRTGQGGTKVVLDRGIMGFPIFHQIVPVSLETMKLEVERRGQDALITKDNLRVDVKGEFYIKVK